MSTLQIVAVADKAPTHDYLLRGWNAFLASCRRYDYEPVILGWGKPWTGLGCKPKLLKQAIDNGIITADHIIFADAFDVWFADHPLVLLGSARANYPDSGIVWNAEKDCFPDRELAKFHPQTESPFKYLNSGLSIGCIDAYMECLTEMKVDEWVPDYQDSNGRWHHRNDQNDWMLRFLFGQCPGQVKMSLDSNCEIFQTLTNVQPEELKFFDAGVWNNTTSSRPLAFHANGPAKTAGLMEPILKHFNL